MKCTKCGRQPLPEQLMEIKTDSQTYHFCKACIKQAHDSLSFKLFKNGEERKLLKNIKRFLKNEKSN